MDNKLKFVTGKTAFLFAKHLRLADSDQLSSEVAIHAAEQMENFVDTEGEYFANIIKYPHFTLQEQDDVAAFCFGIEFGRPVLL
jgi:hypothetical protein